MTNIDSLCLGKACAQLGGARTKANMKIDYSAGVILLKLVGDNIERNEAWIEIHHSTDVLPLDVKNMIQSSLTVETNPNTVKKNIAINLYSQ